MAGINIESIKARYGIIGKDPKLDDVIRRAVDVAATSLSVVIFGENGTGKDNIARIIHDFSARKHNVFLPVNSGSIPEGLLDSELFGHTKGSFTGSVENRVGYFEKANKGTIFLDEIGNIPMSVQARLLRVLQTGEFLRVGASEVSRTDVRVVAATNANLSEMVSNGKFREDLYYRLCAVQLTLPPLRERKEDIPALFAKFALEAPDPKNRGLLQPTADAIEFMKDYYWPGNIRQLMNIVESMAGQEDDRIITAETVQRYVANAPRVKQLPTVYTGGSEQTAFYNHEILLNVIRELRNEVAVLRKEVDDLKVRMSCEMPYQVVGGQPLIEQTGRGVSKLPGVLARVPSGGFPKKAPMASEPEENQYEISSETIDIQEDTDNSIENNEKRLLKKVLEKHKGNRKAAADELGLSERTVYRKIVKYGL